MKLKVAHGNYNVYAYNPQSGKNETVPAEVICIERFLENGTFINDCDMHINVKVPADGFAVIIVDYNALADISLTEESIGAITVSSDYENYTYFGQTEDLGLVF